MCLIVIVGAFLPRVALFLWWLFGEKLADVWTNFWLPFVGFIFLPYTTLFYSFAWTASPVPHVGSISPFGWFLVAFGFLLDLAHWFGSAREGRQRRRTSTV